MYTRYYCNNTAERVLVLLILTTLDGNVSTVWSSQQHRNGPYISVQAHGSWFARTVVGSRLLLVYKTSYIPNIMYQVYNYM